MVPSEDEVIKDTFKLVNKLLNDNNQNIKKIFISDEFKCALYLIKYIENKDDDCYLRFSNIFKKLDKDKKIMVVYYITTYFNENKKEKQKVKKRED